MQPLIQFLTTPLSQHLSKLLEQRIGVLDLRVLHAPFAFGRGLLRQRSILEGEDIGIQIRILGKLPQWLKRWDDAELFNSRQML